MKTKYKYFNFTHDASTDIWACKTNSKVDATIVLGTAEYYPVWKRYCFFPANDTVYSDTCLSDIAKFLNELNGL